MTIESDSSADQVQQPDGNTEAATESASQSEASRTPDEGVKTEQNPLDLVSAALAKTPEQEKPAETPPVKEVVDQEPERPADPKSNMSPKARENFERLEAERDQYREGHERFTAFQGMVRDSGLSADEVDTGFQIMRLAKSDPIKAIEALAPILRNLQSAVGQILPEDLQARVESGEISEDMAKEFARTRFEVNQFRHVAQKSQDQLRLEREAEQAAERERTEARTAEAVSGAVVAWEEGWKKSDPDYQVKQSLVKDRVIALMSEFGRPSTPEDADKLCKRALADINKQLKPLGGQRAAIREVTGGTSSATKPVPSSSVDAVLMALNG